MSFVSGPITRDAYSRAWHPLQVLGGALLVAVLLVGHGLAEEASVSAPPSVLPGGEFEVGWQGPNSPGDFIAIAEPETPAASFVAYARTSGGSPAILIAPGEGEYELRYISATGLTVLARTSLSVGAELAQGGISAPSEVEAGADLVVAVSAAGDPADYITIVEPGASNDAFGPYARIKGAMEVSLAAPDMAGSYEIRQIQASGQAVLARAPLTVLEPVAAETAPMPSETTGDVAATDEAEISTASPQPTALPHATLMALVAVDRSLGFRVAWTGPGAAGDRIGIVPVGGDAGETLGLQQVGDGPPVSLTAPEAPGDYDIVYIAGDNVLARRILEVR
jgi:Ca-activated chloride channel family protein